MSETMIATIISSGVTLIVAIITYITTIYTSTLKTKLEIKQKEHESKRTNLNKSYKALIYAINLFPNKSPINILERIEYSPNYSMENFDTTLKSINYQIEDYYDQLNVSGIDKDRKEYIENQILNREYCKKKIAEICNEYFIAKNEYKSFCKSEKVVFDLYAGADVKKCLVNFEVVIHNVFISGQSVRDVDYSVNIIEESKLSLINSIRKDIGIS